MDACGKAVCHLVFLRMSLRIGLVAKYITKGSTGLARPFAYRFSDIMPDARNQGLKAGGLSLAFLLILLAVLVAVVCKFIRRGGRVAEVFQRVLSPSRIKSFTGPGKAPLRSPPPSGLSC